MAKKFRFNPNKRYNKPTFRNEEPTKKPILSRNELSGTPNEIIKSSKKPISSESSVARAPYNFVPINISVVEASKPPSFEVYSNEHFTGYIDCDLQTLTPIFVGESLTEKELEEIAKKKSDDEKKGNSNEKKRIKTNSDFFSPANKIRIPGSSLRGMVRNLVEIVSWSKFGFFENKNLYYRSFADVSSVRDEYMETICPKDATGRSNYKMYAGYLKKEGFEYYIFPAKKYSKGLQHRRITRDEVKSQLGSIGEKYSEFRYYKLSNGEHIVVSGSMPRKKDWVINERDPDGVKIRIPEKDIESYKLDENRGRNLPKGKKVPNLIEKCDDANTYVPCFYVTWIDKNGDLRVSFGHTGMFRISYIKSIEEHLPPVHINDDLTDFATAIFGVNLDKKDNEESNSSISGRVFFEDAFLKNLDENPFMEKKTSKILLGPKPTSFQLYLEQDSTNKKRLRHYNSDAWIRGNKFYWHKSGEKWEREGLDPNAPPKDIDNVLRPVKPKTDFKFRIRYENMSKIELGALLFALKLPEECAHKIGMGKPIGLGSIKITPHLFVSDRKERYSTIFDGVNWKLGEEEQNEEKVKGFISAFEKEILGRISSEERKRAECLWDTYRLSQLKTLLNIEKGRDLENKNKIEYMMLPEFRSRNVLPHASDI